MACVLLRVQTQNIYHEKDRTLINKTSLSVEADPIVRIRLQLISRLTIRNEGILRRGSKVFKNKIISKYT